MPAGARAQRVLVLALVGALLGACTDHGGEPLPSTTTADPDAVVEGGTMRLGLGGDIVVDPAAANVGSPSDLLVLDLLHDGLTRADDDGTISPALATEWAHDAALTTWTFTLDPTATFASGRAITAADVTASIERIAKLGDASLAALRLESVQGFRAFVDGSAPTLAGLTAPDAQHVQVVLDTPLSVLPSILAGPVFGVLDVASVTAAAQDAGALSALDLSGSWSIERADAERVVLDRRDRTPGHLDAVELIAHEDPDAAYDAFEAAEVDWALVPVDHVDEAVEAHGDEHVTPFQAELFFGLRVSSTVLGNVSLRQAIAAAIDREAIVSEVYEHRADPLASIVPSGVPGHDDDACTPCGHDPERARQLLASAFPDGAIPTVPLDFDESPAQRKMAELIAAQLSAVGIPTELRPKPLAEYEQFVVSGAQELFSFGWIGGYASPDAYLAPMFGSIADDNLTGFAAAEVDAALAEARATDDGAAAQTRWAAVEAQVLEAAVVIPIAQLRVRAVAADRVRGFAAAVDGTVDWSEVWVADGK